MSGFARLLAEVVDLKRVHAAGARGSLAERRFLGAWAALCAGEDPRRVALTEAAAALCGARLGGIDARVLAAGGLEPDAATAVLERAFDQVAGPVGDPLRRELRATLGVPAPGAPTGDAEAAVPAWVRALADQPRAGATAPGRPRLVLTPAESHAEHGWVVAVGAVLAASREDADPVAPFLCGLAHHAHNAVLPDAGFAGEALLADGLAPLLARTTERALAALPERLGGAVREALALTGAAETAEARAFHTADVLDRVLEMRWHARAAAFTLDQALDDLDLVHEGPLQAFGLRVVQEAGLR